MTLTTEVQAILDAHRKRYGWAPDRPHWNPQARTYQPGKWEPGHDAPARRPQGRSRQEEQLGR